MPLGTRAFCKTGGESSSANTASCARTLAAATGCPARSRRACLLGLRPTGLWVGRNLAKQAVSVVVRTGGKEQLVGLAAPAAVAELDGPDLVDDDGLAVGIAQCAEESAGNRIEGVDAAVGNVVGNQQSVTKLAEISRGHRQTPRRMQRAGDAQEHVACGIKLDHETGGRFVATEGHPELAPDVLNAVRSKAALNFRIGKRVHQLEVLVENIDAAVRAVVSRVKKVTGGVAGDGQACVDGTGLGAVRGDLGVSEIHVGVPAADRAVLGSEEKYTDAGCDTIRNREGQRGISESDVKNRAGGCSGSRAPRGRRDDNGQWNLLAGAVVKSGLSRNFVADPEGTAAGSSETPAVD